MQRGKLTVGEKTVEDNVDNPKPETLGVQTRDFKQ
jgi:hypothetical protein